MYFYKKHSYLIPKCLFLRFLFPRFYTFCHVWAKEWARGIKRWWLKHLDQAWQLKQITAVTYFSRFTEHDIVGHKPCDFNFDKSKALDLWHFAHINTLKVIAVSEANVVQLAFLSCSTEHANKLFIWQGLWPILIEFLLNVMFKMRSHHDFDNKKR